MYKVNETKLSEITNNLETIRDSFGKWVDLSIENDSRVIVTSKKKHFLKKSDDVQILGELSKEQSKNISNKIYSGKTIKARIYDFCPTFMTKQNKDHMVMISIWEN